MSGSEPREPSILVREILDSRGEALRLELLDEEVSLDRRVVDPDAASPGLALAGYTSRVPEGRPWVFGETEMSYLGSLTRAEACARLDALFSFETPAVFITKGQRPPDFFREIARRHGVPVLVSGLSTKEFYQRIKPFLEAALAPSTALHGSLADVYGVGLLFVGDSGVGKSECVLDLVERGHRVVADDLVLVSRRGNDVLIGRGHELQRHHMEIRGIGIIDIPRLFGIRAIRQQKRIEVVVHLENWDQNGDYSRTGLDHQEEEILGVSIPRVKIPLNPGKNITVISEIVAMNHLLRYSGFDAAAEFDRRIRHYLEQDYE